MLKAAPFVSKQLKLSSKDGTMNNIMKYNDITFNLWRVITFFTLPNLWKVMHLVKIEISLDVHILRSLKVKIKGIVEVDLFVGLSLSPPVSKISQEPIVVPLKCNKNLQLWNGKLKFPLWLSCLPYWSMFLVCYPYEEKERS